MAKITRMVLLQRLARNSDGAVTLDNAVLISLAAVACFAVIGLFSAPFSVVLGKVFLFSLWLACIAAVANMAKWLGVLSPDTEVQAKTGINL